MRRRFAAAMILTLTLPLLAGCSLGGSSESSEPAQQGAPALPGAPAQPGAPTEDSAGGGAGVAPAEGDRAVISEGYVTITAEDPIAAADRAAGIVERAGGRIDSRSERPAVEGGLPAADLVVRIPAERLTGTLDEIKQLGEVEQVSINATDVTAQTRDLDARIAALRTSSERLVTLLAGATTTEDLIDIETALSERQAELESLESQQRALSEQVALATVSLAFGSIEAAPVDRPDNFFSGVATGWEALLGFLSVSLVALGVVLPWLLLPAVLAGAVLLVIGRRRRRRPAAE